MAAGVAGQYANFAINNTNLETTGDRPQLAASTQLTVEQWARESFVASEDG